MKFSQVWGDSDLSPVFDFGVTPQVFKNLIDAVCVRAYRLPHDPARPLEQTALSLCKFGEEELARRSIANPSTFLKQWLSCEAFCAYVTSKVAYDYEIVEQTLGKGSDLEKERWRRQSVEIVYGLQRPLATCDGYSRITQKFARLAGIQCWHIDGTTRQGHNGKANDGTNHGWVVFELDGGIRVPADTTIQWLGRPPDYARLKGKNGWRTMPVTKRDWEIFNGEYYQTAVIYEQREPTHLRLVSLSNDEWRAFNSIRHDDAKDYFDWEAGLEVGVSWKGTRPH